MLLKERTDGQKERLLKMYNRPFIYFKPHYNSVIPLKIYQTWKTKDLPPKMKECVEKLKRTNPQFEHFLFDDNDCREFIKNHFRKEVLDTYDKLKPGAYKADLWRYCILYINGGIYLDIKVSCINNFKLIELTEKEHFVIDRPPNSIYNCVLCCKRGNPFLLTAINQIVENAKNNYYGETPLHPTGPCMLGKVAMKYGYRLNLDMNHYIGGNKILYKNTFVLSSIYPSYASERKGIHYGELWKRRDIYN